MLRQFFCEGGQRRVLFAWLGLLVFIGHQVFRAWLKFAINNWYEVFYDHLQQASTNLSATDDAALAASQQRVTELLWEFAFIAAPAVFINPIGGLFRNWWVLEWRLSLMQAYIEGWDTSAQPIEGAAQRVHEDTQRFAKGIQSCIAQVLEALLTLGVFCPVLYSLRPSLMKAALAIATGGLMVSIVVGRRLVGLEVQNQVVEAAVRKQLVVMEVDPASSLMDANEGSNGSMVVMDSAPHSIFHTLLHDLKVNYRRLYSQFFALAAWLASYEQAAVIVPYAMMAPYLFAVDPAQRTTLGSLVKLSNAFNKVFDSVNIVSDNFLEINEWRSVLVRLREFEREMFHPEHTAGSKKFPGQHGFMQPIPTDEYEGAASPRLARTPRPFV